ncbi:MAG: arginine--tRNA ligase [Candidatus Bipolaricaulia bacterium]
MNPLVDEIARRVGGVLDVPTADVRELMTTPPDDSMGDYALPCFALAQRLRRSPAEIAQELAEAIVGDPIRDAQAAGPYLNVTVDRGELMSHVLGRVLQEGERFGGSDEGADQTIVIDYSSPNIARPFSVGHLRSTVLGHTLKLIHRHLGYDVVGVNYLGDWGKQFGALIAAYKRWGSREQVEADRVYELFRLYVDFHEEAETTPELEDEARHWFQKLEAGDAEATDLWEWFVAESLEAFRTYYDMLGIEFEEIRGESAYRDQASPLIERLMEEGIAQESEGAIVIPLEADEADADADRPPLMLRKRDGATVYATRDLCAAIYHQQQYEFDWKLYVVDAGQSLHFQQFFEALTKMGYDWAERLVHVAFGVVLFEDQRMSTRKGRVVFFEDVAQQAIDRTREIIENVAKIADLPQAEREQIAHDVGVSAVIYATISRSRTHDINFRWEDVVNFEGKSGPYIQYTHARMAGVLRKADRQVPEAPAYARLTERSEVALAKWIEQFPDKVRHAAETYDPFTVAAYLGDLAAVVNKFYDTCRVLGEDAELEGARLALVQSAQTVLATGLGLIGMSAPERM